jgi:site-specific DNA recombinase
MPALRNRERMLRSDLQAIMEQINDRAAFLRLAETLMAFLVRLRSNAETLDVAERQRIVRLVVKEVLVGENDITIRHSTAHSFKLPAKRRFAFGWRLKLPFA